MPNRKIALEEHYSGVGMEKYLDTTLEPLEPALVAPLRKALADVADLRLQAMDSANIDICVLSQTSPGVQIEANPEAAVQRARSANDYLQAQIARYPARFRGFAHLAMQDADAACAELTRCVRDLGFVGGMINGQTDGTYLDDARYLPFWERVAELKVPIYLHPAEPYQQPHVLRGYPETQGAVWGWSFETSSHFLRLLFSGLFDRYPSLTVILGHMGELLPINRWRIDGRYALLPQAKDRKIKKAPSHYLRENLMITTSGVCQDSALLCALAELGEDRVMFSVDYPYEDSAGSGAWIDAAPVSEEVREKICRKNAARLLRL